MEVLKVLTVWVGAVIATALTLENAELLVRIIAYSAVAGFTISQWWQWWKNHIEKRRNSRRK